MLESALGGTLLIDEAYALARGSEQDFGREAIDTIVKFMEDHRDDLAVIAAGYPDEMATLIDANPGLQSRFARTIHFPDYTTEELVAIFESMSAANRYHLDEAAALKLAEIIDAEPRTRGFGNARFVRNVFEAAVSQQAERLAAVEQPTDEQLTTLTAADLDCAVTADRRDLERVIVSGPTGRRLARCGARRRVAARARRAGRIGLVGDRGHEERDDEVDEVAGEQPVALVRALARPAAELDVGEAHRRVAAVQRRADDPRRQQRGDEPAPAGDAVARIAAARVGQDRRLAGSIDAGCCG